MRRHTAIVVVASLAASLTVAVPRLAHASDDGSQLASPFRIDYLGYLQKGPKVAACLAPQGGSAAWALKDASGAVVTTGTSTDYVAKDFASGDSFFRIVFSSFEGAGKGFRLSVSDCGPALTR